MLSKQQQDYFYKLLGNAIKAARNRVGMKQETLAKQLGFVSRISIVNIESGKQKVQLHTLLEISDILKIPVNELLPAIDGIKQDINPHFAKKLKFNKEIKATDSIEKIKNLIRFTSSDNKKA